MNFAHSDSHEICGPPVDHLSYPYSLPRQSILHGYGICGRRHNPDYRSSTTTVDTRNKRPEETGGEGTTRAFFSAFSLLSTLSVPSDENDLYAGAQDY